MKEKITIKPGDVFGRLTVLQEATRIVSSGVSRAAWMVKCSCDGKIIPILAWSLKSGNSTSCGCWNRECTGARFRTHGRYGTPEYRRWHSMLQRCINPNAPGYENYGGRGILVCSRWANGEGSMSAFECFFADVGPMPSPRHSLDRYPDVNGHYEPANVRWATTAEQARNKRNNVWVTLNGERMVAQDAAHRIGVDRNSLQYLTRKYCGDAQTALDALLARQASIAEGQLKKPKRLTKDEREAILRAAEAGARTRDIAAQFGMSEPTISQIKSGAGLAAPRPRRLTRDERIEVQAALACGEAGRDIAARYGVCESTVSDIKTGRTRRLSAEQRQ